MSIEAIETEAAFNDFIKAEKLIVAHFCAAWADQCQQINDLLTDFTKADDYKDAKYCKIDAEAIPEVSLKYKITSVPTVLLIKNSKIVDRVDGVKTGELGDKIKQQLANKTGEKTRCEVHKETLEERLKKLTNQASCMLFMKGDPKTPRCGFSRTIVGLLDSLNADYQTFDILQDNEVREGLKKFSNWPTYPQLYINGDLIGGLDIVKEMVDNGELMKTLPKKVQN